jgi:dolichyl-diphosphooligosaccharide---protein glycosyltransferase
MDLHFLIFLFPAGVVYCFKELRDEHVFVIVYAAMASYFASVMVRLMLTLTPVVCISAAVAFSHLLDTYLDPTVPEEPKSEEENAPVSSSENVTAPKKSTKKERKRGIFAMDTRFAVIANSVCLLMYFVFHCTWVTASAYSSPSVVLASTNPDGSQHIIDDFREAYYWLRQNTPETAVIMSWWDYGYQIAGMADRPTLVDNNTWNNSTFE